VGLRLFWLGKPADAVFLEGSGSVWFVVELGGDLVSGKAGWRCGVMGW
jgi:hypothetical protein